MPERNMNDDLFDLALKHALLEIENERANEAEQIFTQYADTDTKPPKRLREQTRRAISEEKPKPSRTFGWKVYKKRIVLVAAILGIAIAAAFAVEANGFSIFKYLFYKNNTYTTVEFVGNIETRCIEEMPENWPAIYFPQNIPDGFELQEITFDRYRCWITFVKGERSIDFMQVKIQNSQSISFDTEDAKMQKLKINGYDVFMIKKDGQLSINYSNDEMFLSGDFYGVKQKQAIKFMSNLKKLSK